MDGAWRATVHGVAKESDTTEQLNITTTTKLPDLPDIYKTVYPKTVDYTFYLSGTWNIYQERLFWDLKQVSIKRIEIYKICSLATWN